ncbi:MAG: phenylalanine--tRNA ligase subunit alpha [Cryomorphaceae bacterium]|jgi:phenylalanyl-tRNA synthetase alpha chain|nr:phenylalanine--tRNA ligase subunit alpha [Cryomorphaceae bacterium]
MQAKIQEYLHEVASATLLNAEAAEALRLRFLGRKGVMNELFAAFKTLAPEERKEVGQRLNELKTAVEAKVAEFSESKPKVRIAGEDVTRPGWGVLPGSHHPVSQVRNELVDIFRRMGFAVAEGPEMEDDWHNFTALNFPPEHPARDMQDTFFLARNPDWALRTHTSNVQVRTMETRKPPIRIIAPGRVFRNEAISSRSHCMFHQVEGLYIDRNVSFADMKQTLLEFAQAFFGEHTAIRLRPSYFPFTEPSAEMDIWWGLETETDYRMTKGTGWLEILGCGMVDPAVLESCGIDPAEYSGFAFGLGVERIAMQRFSVPDIRALFENDLRMLRAL